MRVEQLNDEQRAMYDWIASMSEEKAQEYLTTLPGKRESGASRKQKIATLGVRLDAGYRILGVVEDYVNRVGELINRLQREEVSAKEVDLRLHTLPKVPGIVLRLEGKPRGPRAAKDPEEAALARMSKGNGKRGRKKGAEKVQEEAVVV